MSPEGGDTKGTERRNSVTSVTQFPGPPETGFDSPPPGFLFGCRRDLPKATASPLGVVGSLSSPKAKAAHGKEGVHMHRSSVALHYGVGGRSEPAG